VGRALVTSWQGSQWEGSTRCSRCSGRTWGAPACVWRAQTVLQGCSKTCIELCLSVCIEVGMCTWGPCKQAAYIAEGVPLLPRQHVDMQQLSKLGLRCVPWHIKQYCCQHQHRAP
jgi:hypothetical protein